MVEVTRQVDKSNINIGHIKNFVTVERSLSNRENRIVR